MKRLFVIALVLAGCRAVKTQRVEAIAGGTASTLSGDLSFRADGLTGTASFNDLGLDGVQSFPVLGLAFDASQWFLDLTYQDWMRRGTGIITTPLEFDGTQFLANTRVRSDLRMTRWDQRVGSWLGQKGDLKWGLVANLSQYFLEGRLTSTGGVTPPGVALVFDVDFPMLAVGPIVELRRKTWSAGMSLTGLGGSIEDHKYTTVDATAHVAWTLHPHHMIGLATGWRRLSVDAPLDGERALVDWEQPMFQISWRCAF
ncbi:MAG: hypothetical protein ISQ08_05855 [Planctomycetes bacterium]|nr:hypothetical protein [Planctomycetota bacterium]